MNKTHEMYQSLITELNETGYGPQANNSRKYISENGIGLIYSISIAHQMRSMAIPIEGVDRNVDYPVWRGVRIDAVTITEYSRDQVYIQLKQASETEGHIFEIVAEDLRLGIEKITDRKKTGATVRKILKKWKDFFSTGRRPILGEKQEQGLVGELLFLNELIKKADTKAVGFWESGTSTHDFYISNNAVEVKTSICQAPYYGHINSEYQLDKKDINGSLFLRMYALRRSPRDGKRLPQIINETRELLISDETMSDLFESKIFTLGYFDSAADYYQNGYTIRDKYTFSIDDDFPKLIKSGIPEGIYHIEYDINVGECMDFAISTDELFRKLEI